MLQQFMDHLPFISQIWKYKLLTVQGVKLSVGNIFLALVLLIIAKRDSRFVDRMVMKKLVIPFVDDQTAVNTYRKLIHTSTFALFVVVALSVAGIPLTVFTVVGGALAIGIGFGSQNIVNNFISGLILMVERPLKVGDTVEINGVSGTVSEIGTRATRIRTIESKVWLIPNSMFLENPVLNWTNRDAIVRTEVTVGVSYSSDPAKVRDLALAILNQMPFVEQSPYPRIMFDDFGDNSLIFKLQFWADTEKVDSLQQCRSDVRFAIDKAFRREGIEISYPQRDLHLKSAAPLEVRLKS